MASLQLQRRQKIMTLWRVTDSQKDGTYSALVDPEACDKAILVCRLFALENGRRSATASARTANTHSRHKNPAIPKPSCFYCKVFRPHHGEYIMGYSLTKMLPEAASTLDSRSCLGAYSLSSVELMNRSVSASAATDNCFFCLKQVTDRIIVIVTMKLAADSDSLSMILQAVYAAI